MLRAQGTRRRSQRLDDSIVPVDVPIPALVQPAAVGAVSSHDARKNTQCFALRLSLHWL